jgi:hypothetical protein
VTAETDPPEIVAVATTFEPISPAAGITTIEGAEV